METRDPIHKETGETSGNSFDGDYKGKSVGEIVERCCQQKIDMLVFDRNDPASWIFRAEHYFDIHKLTSSEKLAFAVVSLEDDVVQWFRWAANRKPFTS